MTFGYDNEADGTAAELENATTPPGAVAPPEPGEPLPYRAFISAVTDVEAAGQPVFMAAGMLARMRRNRIMSLSHRDSLARDMLSGSWYHTGDPFRRGADGMWDDCQHRASAVIEANRIDPAFVGVWGLVQDSLAEEARAVVDTNRPRSYGDVHRMRGTENYGVVASVTKRMVHWDQGVRLAGALTRLSPRELDAYLSDHDQEILPAVKLAASRAVRRESHLSATAFAVLSVVLSRVDPAKADEFTEKLVSGTELPAGDAILALRSRLSKEASTARRYTTTKDQEFRLAMCFAAWNIWRKGRKVTHLTITRGRLTSRNYPVPR